MKEQNYHLEIRKTKEEESLERNLIVDMSGLICLSDIQHLDI